MYSSEIEAFLREHNYVVTIEECNRLIDLNNNPQIEHIKYFCANNEYVVSTKDNYTFKFYVVPN